jgi:hypothetical protein
VSSDAPARWLLTAGVDGLGLTKTHVLQRAIVRAAAERWPQSWNHDLFGPPNREAELPVLEAAREGLCRLRLLRRQRETLRTTPRGRELLRDDEGLLRVLHGDMGAADRFDADVWPLVEAALRDRGPLELASLTQLVRPLVHLQGWRGAASGARHSTAARCGANWFLCCRRPRPMGWSGVIRQPAA